MIQKIIPINILLKNKMNNLEKNFAAGTKKNKYIANNNCLQ